VVFFLNLGCLLFSFLYEVVLALLSLLCVIIPKKFVFEFKKFRKMESKVKKYYIKTFGCQMNEAESEMIAAGYECRGWKQVKNWQEANEVVINSCSVRESAENRVFGLVNNISKFKIKNTKCESTIRNLKLERPKIILSGCMVGSAMGERKRYTFKQLKQRLPQVAEFRPWWEWDFKKMKAIKTRKDKQKALVPIMTGCNHFCSYCVVPYAKGKEISFPFEDILCQIKEFGKKGWQEVILLGQNVNTYGKDFTKEEKDKIISCYHDSCHSIKDISIFSLLLRAVHKIKKITKISFLTSNPWDLTDDIIQAMKLPKVDRYLHLPLQSGDNTILKNMNRPYTVEQYWELVRKIRNEIPGIKIGTDLIVGFPGETKKAFENTVKLCQKIGFEKAYIAMYSPRPGTSAFKFKDNISYQEKKRRWSVLEKLINKKLSVKES